MLKELAKSHDKWLQMAFLICRSRDKSPDIVQDMYLKVHSLNLEEVKPGYVYAIMRSIFIDEIRADKRSGIFIDAYLPEQVSSDVDTEYFEEQEVLHEIIATNLNNLEWHERTMIKLSNEIGVRPLARQAGISKESIMKARKKLKAICLKD